MLKNTNQGVVQKLAARSLRQNRVRNLFAILAIILTTFMFTTVFSIGFSLGRNLSIMMLRQQGTKRSICLNQPEKEQIEQVKKAKYLNAAGIQVPICLAADTSDKTNIRLDYYDTTEFEKNLTPAISNIHGSYPEKVDEIMISKAGLSAMKIKEPKQGMDIVLVMDSAEKTFHLSGWFTDYASSAGGFQGLVSKAYVSSIHKTVEQDGVLSISAVAGKKELLLKELESRVTLKQGQQFDSSWDIQEENQGNVLVIACAIGFMGLIIITSGYLLIYNIMYISVTKDIRFYGMLKTIGTSPSQIRKIVRSQISRLSVIGVPFGIGLGSILAFWAVPLAMRMFSIEDNEGAMPQNVSFNPLIYVGTILFAVITVAVSCRKPAKLAGKVSPVEALKYQGQTSVKRRGRKTTDGGKLYKMSFRNVFREKKRAFLVFASLFMGTMAFLSVNTFLGSMKLENYVDYYLPNDFTINIVGEKDEEGNNNILDIGQSKERESSNISHAEQLVEDLRKIEGITEMSVNHTADLALEFDVEVFRPFLERDLTDETSMQDMIDFYTQNADDRDETYSAPVISVSSAMIKKYNEHAKQKIDISRFEKGEICLVGEASTREEAEEVRGKQITLKDLDTGKTLDLEIGSCPTYEEGCGLNIGYSWQKGGAPAYIVISDTAMEKICDNPMVDNIIIDCDPKRESRVKSRIKSLIRSNTCVGHTS
ncbi:MAG: FtsX-like permease family protein, partial [Lachnospiraceae bacterium]|nr:FtsX-like permease family protein [Lachnospiraceae bacterium]